MAKCSRPTCFAPESSCDLGFIDRSKCSAWKAVDTAQADGGVSNGEILLPWSGSALGLLDLGFVAGRTKPLVVAIAGPENAGKTTLLAAWYLLLGRGSLTSKERTFAGSYSLSGWEAVASALRWAPGRGPRFPPHTASGSGRIPGLLHLAFRNIKRELSAYLLTDAPGEWFQKWAVNRDAEAGEGAKWIAEHSDVFLLIADREALSGPNMGSARGAMQLLAQRLAGERHGRPLALVWTKADVPISAEMERSVRDAVFGPMPDAIEFFVSVIGDRDDAAIREQGLVQLLEWILSTQRKSVLLPKARSSSLDPLFTFGVR